MEGKDNPWTLESPTIISKMGSLSASTTTSIGIWPRNVGRKKRKRQEDVLNMTKKSTLPRIVKENN